MFFVIGPKEPITKNKEKNRYENNSLSPRASVDAKVDPVCLPTIHPPSASIARDPASTSARGVVAHGRICWRLGRACWPPAPEMMLVESPLTRQPAHPMATSYSGRWCSSLYSLG